MSKRLDVLTALKALMVAALPAAQVVGLDEEEDTPSRVPAGGRVVVPGGDPGEPEVDLSPLIYNYAHEIPIDVIMADEVTLDAALVAIGTAIEADRQLGSRCEYLDAVAPNTINVGAEGAPALRGARVLVTAYYSSPHPLT